MLTLTFWKGHYAAYRFDVESEEAAFEWVRRVAADPGYYLYDFDGWSLTDERGFWLIEEGEKLIPVKAA